MDNSQLDHHQLERPRIPTMSRRTPSIVRVQFDPFKNDENLDYSQFELSREKVVPSKRGSLDFSKRGSLDLSKRGSIDFSKDPNKRAPSINLGSKVPGPEAPVELMIEDNATMKLAPEPPRAPSRSSIFLDLAAGAVKAREDSLLKRKSSMTPSKGPRATPKWVQILGYPTTAERLAEEKKWLAANAATLGDISEEEVQQVVKQLEPFEVLRQRFQAVKKLEFQSVRLKMMRASSHRAASTRGSIASPSTERSIMVN